jgi:ribosomal protein S18 acetylase RimI-like enzyme
MPIEIKEIHAEDTYEIRHKVMWPDKNIDFVKLEEDKMGHHFGLFDNDVLVSIVSVFYAKEEAQFRKFATLVAYQRRGHGSKLLNNVFQIIENQGFEKIWCDARVEKKGFYEKLGMVAVGSVFMKNGIEYIVMERNF